SARSIRSGMTLPLVLASSSFINGMFTRLKKYSRPTQVIPAMKWIQRSSIRKFVWKSEGSETSDTNNAIEASPPEEIVSRKLYKKGRGKGKGESVLTRFKSDALSATAQEKAGSS